MMSEQQPEFKERDEQAAYDQSFRYGELIGSLSRAWILQEELQMQALLDPLTGLPNRRAMELIYRQLHGRMVRNPQDEKVCVLYADIDHFKTINDTFGHGVGDEVLREVARVLAENLREEDVVGRDGGEEFVALLPNTDVDSGKVIAERLREAVEDIHQAGEQQIHMTVSIGLAVINERYADFAAASEPADKAMYLAKDAGRNRVHVAETA